MVPALQYFGHDKLGHLNNDKKRARFLCFVNTTQGSFRTGLTLLTSRRRRKSKWGKNTGVSMIGMSSVAVNTTTTTTTTTTVFAAAVLHASCTWNNEEKAALPEQIQALCSQSTML